MSKQFKKGDKVWTWRYTALNSSILVTESTVLKAKKNGVLIIKHGEKETTCVEQLAFPTKQECIDHIINSIKVIPYEKTSDN